MKALRRWVEHSADKARWLTLSDESRQEVLELPRHLHDELVQRATFLFGRSLIFRNRIAKRGDVGPVSVIVVSDPNDLHPIGLSIGGGPSGAELNVELIVLILDSLRLQL